MKQNLTYISILGLFLISAAFVSAQRLQTPQTSQKASVMQRISLAEVSITYSRPAVKGRAIWGDPPAGAPAGEATLDDSRTRPAGSPVVYWGKLWRTGANEATLFSVSDDVIINGQPLTAGKYSLHTIPGKAEWIIIFNKDDGQWGSFAYDAAKDALRIKVKPEWTTQSRELLTYDFEPVTANSATINIRWEKVNVPFTVEVKDPASLALTKIRSQVAAAKSDDWQMPFSAGNWAKNNKAPEDEIKFFEQALRAIDAQIKAKETFQSLQRKASTLLALKRGADALAVAERALVVGKADPTVKPADIEALEKRIADMKPANSKPNPTSYITPGIA